jgi:SAM-dependent methyltransferase
MSEWFEDDRFWEATFDTMFPPSRFDETEREIASLLELVKAPVHDALDLCCGPGRATVALARRGIRVTGVDRSAFMLGKAKTRAAENDASVTWVEEDMRRFAQPEAFDLVLSLFTSFGYFDLAEDNLKVLRNVRQSLRPGGALVMDLMSKERLARIFEPASFYASPTGRLVFEKRRVFDDWERVEVNLYVLENGAYEAFTFRHYVYSGRELRALLHEAGFASVELYGGFDGRPYTGAARLHVVARA